ncbi:MAG: SprT-like domain-containing protein [Paramuribaculum sp.]|nr:SprT-like domain-containing protein [Paramuribaculum sp.]
MRPDQDFVEGRYDEFNRRMFGGRLPKVRMRLAQARTYLGKCIYKVRLLPDGRREAYDFEIRVSTLMDLPERVVEDTIIHEMIHYFILVNGLQDTSSHGRIFRAIMASINDTHGRNIAISHKADAVQRESAAPVRRRWHVIAVVELADRRRVVKVLPRVEPKVVAYYKALKGMRQVRGVELYLHDNPFFDRFPTSTSMRMAEVDDSILREALAEASRLGVSGSRLVRL